MGNLYCVDLVLEGALDVNLLSNVVGAGLRRGEGNITREAMLIVRSQLSGSA